MAVHDLNKTREGFNVKLGKEGLAVSKTTQRVIDDLYQLYRRRTSKSHGKFSLDDDYSPTRKHMRAYLDGDCTEFYAMTSKMMETLRRQASNKGAAQGGHVFFAHFARDGAQYLLVAIINDKLGARLTGELDVRDVEHLDIDGFRFAGRINLTAWSEDQDRYIGFLKGKGNVSDYFKQFLGCDTAVQDREDTVGLVRALKSFADAQEMDQSAKNQFLARAKDICERASKARLELSFDAFANELMPAAPDVLLEALTDPELKLNDGFVPDRGGLRMLVRFKAQTQDWTVEFEREAITGGKVVFNEAENTLTLKELPADLTARLREEFARDG
ncbi:nucleoid-associated protein [Bosea sp. TWI1241]|uniref:nucleoid-associated protein n=1 Tax=Bosea sp. TWI1241 TaxID=3148904 RepID=UPI00320A6BF2